MYEFGCCYYTQPPDGGSAQDIIICASNLKVYKDFMDGNILIYIINIGNIGRGYAHRDTDFLRHSKLHEDTQTRRPECSVPISPSASMSGGGAVGGCDLSGLQQESSFWEYSFIAGHLDAYHQLSAEVLAMDWLLSLKGLDIITHHQPLSVSTGGVTLRPAGFASPKMDWICCTRVQCYWKTQKAPSWW